MQENQEVSHYGTVMTVAEIQEAKHATPYGYLDDKGVEYLIEQGVAKFDHGVWILRVYSVDAKKRKFKDGVSYRSDEVSVVFVPYMSYVLEYVMQRFADLEKTDTRFELKKLIQKNTSLHLWFDDVNEQLGYFGLSSPMQRNRKVISKQSETEAMPFL